MISNLTYYIKQNFTKHVKKKLLIETSMLPNAFVEYADSLVFFHFVVGLVRFFCGSQFLWINILFSKKIIGCDPSVTPQSVPNIFAAGDNMLQEKTCYVVSVHGIDIYLFIFLIKVLSFILLHSNLCFSFKNKYINYTLQRQSFQYKTKI